MNNIIKEVRAKVKKQNEAVLKMGWPGDMKLYLLNRNIGNQIMLSAKCRKCAVNETNYICMNGFSIEEYNWEDKQFTTPIAEATKNPNDEWIWHEK